MASIQQVAELLLSVSGEDAVEDLNQQLGYTEKTLEQLKAAFSRGEMTTDEFIRTAGKLTSQEKLLRDQIDAVTAAMNKQTAAADASADAAAESVGKVGKAGTDSAHRLLQIGQTLDDLQYVGEMGLRPIINNVMQLDARAGIALIVIQSLANAVGEQLVKAFADYIGTGEKAVVTIDSLSKKIEDLEKKPHKISTDYSDLDRARETLAKLKAEQEAYEAGKGDKQAQALGSAATDVTSSYLGGSDALQGVVLAMEKAGGFQHGSTVDQALLAKLNYQLEHPEFDARTGLAKVDPETIKRTIDEVQSRMARAASDFAKREVSQFNAGDVGAIQRMKNRATQNPGAFGRIGADGLTGAEALRDLASTPAEMRRRAQVDAEIADTDAIGQEQNAAFGRLKAKRATAAKEREAALKKSREETEREDAAIDKFNDVENPANEAKAAAARAKQLDAFRANQEYIKADEAKRAADPVANAQSKLAAEAARMLRGQGASPKFAEEAAPKLAELLGQGMDLQTATMRAIHETQMRLNGVDMKIRLNEQWLRLIQSNVGRARTMQPTTQPVPFAIP